MNTKVVVLEFHGLKQGILTEDLSGFPNFQELIKGSSDQQAYLYMPRVFTTIPAASQPATTSMYTGLYPQRTGVVSTIWFDRSCARMRTLISYLQDHINRILAANHVPSIFDLVAAGGKHSQATMLMLTKGADWTVKSGAHFWGNAALAGFFHNSRWIPESHYVDDRTVHGFLSGHLFQFFDSVRGIQDVDGDIPDLMVVQLLGTDLFTHYPSAELTSRSASVDEIQSHYVRTVLDPLVGEIISTFKQLGCYDKTVFILVSEHGFTRIDKHVPDGIVERCLENKFKMPRWWRNKEDADAVVMPGASTKEIYIKNRQTGSWMDPPLLLADVKPAVDLLLADPDIRSSLSTLLIRQYPGERQEGIAEHDSWWVFDCRGYRAGSQNGQDFLRALQPLDVLRSTFEIGDHLVQALRRQYTRETAPDIQLVNRKGYYFENDLRKYAHHGSYYPNDCIVSFWAAGPGLAGVLPGRHLWGYAGSTLDLTPMVAYLLGVPAPEGLDGKNPLLGISRDGPFDYGPGRFSLQSK